MKLRLCILPFLMAAMFTSCAPVESEPSSENSISENKEYPRSQLTWQECLSQEESHYLIYFYSDTCAHCHEIIEDVLAFYEDEVTKLYFLNINEGEIEVPISSDIDLTIGMTTVDNLFIAGTPTIIEVEDGRVKANVPGKNACLSFLNEQRLNKNS